jgi:hypothetical protein
MYVAFWQWFAPLYKDNTNVIYELRNEPNDLSVCVNNIPEYFNTLYSTVRPLAPNTPLVAITTNGLWPTHDQVPGWLQNTPKLWADGNVVFGWHDYDWAGGTSAQTVDFALTISNGTCCGLPGIPTFMTEDNGPITNEVPDLASKGISWSIWQEGWQDSTSGINYVPYKCCSFGPFNITWPED